MHPILALRAFFAVLFGNEIAKRFKACLEPTGNQHPTAPSPLPLPESTETSRRTTVPSKSKSSRSDAITLLSTLQREARLLDLIFESLEEYSDSQIGAAARDVLRDSKKSLQKTVGLKPLVESEEGSQVDIPDPHSPARWRIVGKESAKSGTLSHCGWQATRLDLPMWSGNVEDSMVIAAAEIET